MDTLQAIEARKSTRNFLSKQVEPEKLEQLAMAATHAPNAGGFQVTIITNPDIIREIDQKALVAMKNSGNDFLMSRAALSGYQPLCNTPVLFILSAPDGPYNMANASCSATSICIGATALGLGSCYVVTPTLALGGDRELCAKIGIPDGYHAQCGVLIGYAGDEAFSAAKKRAANINYCK